MPVRPWFVLICLTACAHDPEVMRQDAARRTADNRGRAVDRAMRDASLTRVDLPTEMVDAWMRPPDEAAPPPVVRLRAPAAGLQGGEQIVDLPASAAGPGHRDGRLVILRVRPIAHTEVVKRAGTCGYGCGMQAPPPPITFISLPSDDVRLLDVPYDLHRVEVTCEHPMPMP
jgi:hypothetical protein